MCFRLRDYVSTQCLGIIICVDIANYLGVLVAQRNLFATGLGRATLQGIVSATGAAPAGRG